METVIQTLNPEIAEQRIPTGENARIWVTSPVDRPFDYINLGSPIALGAIVDVPFGARNLRGVVWGRGEANAKNKLKPIAQLIDLPPLRAPMRRFIERMAQYTLTPIGQILPMVIRTPGPAITPAPWLVRNTEFSKALSPRRRLALDAIGTQPTDPRTIEASKGIIKALVDSGAARFVPAPAPTRPRFLPRLDRLTEAQGQAFDQINSTPKPSLLKGITGSGKTEVYLELIAARLAKGGQALVLLPEISLTDAFLDRFTARFGFRPAHWHSAMATKDRRQIWHDVATGNAPIVIGARSSLFLPFADLRLIVVDEAHDRGYKQDEGVIYHGRDMAVLRGAVEGAKLVLATATPSVESMVNVDQGKYQLVTLDARFGSARLPSMEIVDMNGARLDGQHFIAPALQQAIKARLNRSEQSLLFLNRRGFAPLTLCRACGHQLGCPNCDTRLVEHRHDNRLQCHQCGFARAIPMHCPECDAEDRLVALGPGVERIAHEVQDYFPGARVKVLSSDINSGEDRLANEIAAIAAGDYDIIIGTQIVAKGHNFPNLTLVGIIDADIGLEGGDLRAAEASFQILRQVSGRAGRGDQAGVAMIQSYVPSHPILRAIIDADDTRFYTEEIARRRLANAPPFSRYFGVLVTAPDFSEAMQTARQLVANAESLRQNGIEVFGPVPAPIARIRGRARVRILLKSPRNLLLHDLIKAWRNSIKTNQRLRVALDVDPQNFL